MKQIKTSLLSTCLILIGFVATGQNIVHVNSSTGNDVTGDGSISAPYKTFHKGYVSAASGEILALTGTFTWTDADETGDAITTGYTIGKNIIVRGSATNTAIIQAASTENTADRRVLTISAGFSVQLIDVTIQHGYVNTAVNYDGGAGVKNSGTLYMDGCLVTKNRTHTGGYQFGAGVLTAGSGSATIISSTISYNSSTGSNGWGAGMMHGNYGSPGALVMRNSTVHDNTTTTGRGAFTVMLTGANVNKITNCTFYNNSSTTSGALWIDRTTTVFTNCTVVNNPLGGISFYGNSIYLKNNLLANNGTYDFSYGAQGTIYNGGYNLVETSNAYSFAATGDITGDQANLHIDATSADNSSLNGTRTFAIQSNSVAVNAGNATAHGPVGNTVSASLYDQRSYARAGTVDIGAYEYDGTPSYCWEGRVSTDWNVAANWRNKTVPSGIYNLVMYPVVTYNHLQLDQDRSFGLIDFTGATYKLVLGNYHLTGTTFTGASNTSYAQTNSSGTVKSTITNAGSRSFPVGNSSYNPVSITNNTGSTDEFNVRVVDEVFANGASGASITANRVQRTWDIGKTNPNSGSGINFVFNFNVGDKVGTLATSALFHYSGGWSKQTGTTTYNSTSLTYTGYTGTFSPFAVVEGSATLPVSWLSFEASREGNTALLGWSTATEQHAESYTVQHSRNGRDWSAIGTRIAAGNSQTVQQYNFVHTNPIEGVNYYRLLQNDLNGGQSFSKIISINFAGLNRQLSVYPNPVVNGRLNVQLEKAATLQVFNSVGMIVLQKDVQAGSHQLSLEQLPKGMYRLKAATETVSFIIQ